MKKAIFTIAILSVLFSSCGLGGQKSEETAADSTAVSLDSTTVDTLQNDTTVVDSTKCCQN